MPSPFPGMDPYLEDADMFPSLHGNLVFAIQELLQPQLPEPYFAKTGEKMIGVVETAGVKQVVEFATTYGTSPAFDFAAWTTKVAAKAKKPLTLDQAKDWLSTESKRQLDVLKEKLKGELTKVGGTWAT